jgi:O-acetyl-ADP-ribose deacetylase (regulator of RNase III)
MIEFRKDEILNANAEAIVNTVNTVGIMGKGIALEIKEKFPQNYQLYKKACERNEVVIGKMFTTFTNTLENPKYIINFPTKRHWRFPSEISFVKEGLEDLKNVILSLKIKSIAVPPLGCGNGKLDWNIVKPLIIKSLENIPDLDIFIYEPLNISLISNNNISNKNITLNPVRALVLTLFERYMILGYDITLLEAQKLTYFLQRFGENLKLNYTENTYGPYARNLDYLLNYLDGHFIKGMRHRDIKPFDKIELIEEKRKEISECIKNNCTVDQKERLKKVSDLIEGFESPLGMELLATVDFIINKNREIIDNEEELIVEVQKWSKRKKELLKPQFIKVAQERLVSYKELYN